MRRTDCDQLHLLQGSINSNLQAILAKHRSLTLLRKTCSVSTEQVRIFQGPTVRVSNNGMLLERVMCIKYRKSISATTLPVLMVLQAQILRHGLTMGVLPTSSVASDLMP